jgi:hypothetical protein
MQLHILGVGGRVRQQRLAQLRKPLLDAGHLLGRASDRRQPRGLGLEHEAHLVAAHRRSQFGKGHVGAQLVGGPALDERAGAAPGLGDAVGGQPNEGLAHDRARHAEDLRQARLGRQTIADRQSVGVDHLNDARIRPVR